MTEALQTRVNGGPEAPRPYPVRLEGHLDEPLSRGLWLVKWVLVIPHAVVLAFLWLAVLPVWIVSLVAVVVTGRYPEPLFRFVVGVLRWTWRVQFYSYSALGTDRYPPFSLADDPTYPARLHVAYPGHQSRGLALVQWWLLALPHYLLVGVFAGSSFSWGASGVRGQGWSWPGLIALLVLVAGVTLLITRRYPRHVFDLVLGLDRWCVRVAAYALLLTDSYPPFRLDQGGSEGPIELDAPRSAPHGVSGWTGPRVALAVVGSLVALLGAPVALAGGAALWADQTQRDASGLLGTDTHRYATATSALTIEGIDLGTPGEVAWPRRLLGTVRLRATGSRPLFLGVGPADDVSRYLAGVAHEHLTDVSSTAQGRIVPGTRPAALPQDQPFWVARSSGPGLQELRWDAAGGRWSAVVLNADGSPGVVAEGDVAAGVPRLTTIGVVVLAAGGVLVLLGIGLLVLAVVRSSRAHPRLPVQDRRAEPLLAGSYSDPRGPA